MLQLENPIANLVVKPYIFFIVNCKDQNIERGKQFMFNPSMCNLQKEKKHMLV